MKGEQRKWVKEKMEKEGKGKKREGVLGNGNRIHEWRKKDAEKWREKEGEKE